MPVMPPARLAAQRVAADTAATVYLADDLACFAEAREALRIVSPIVAIIDALVGTTARSVPRMALYLVQDPLGAAPPIDLPPGVAVVPVPQAADLAPAVARLALAARCGPAAAHAAVIVAGVVALAATGLPLKAAAAAADEMVRSARRAGGTVRIFAAPGTGQEHDPVTTSAVASFTAFLVDEFGSHALRQYLTAFEPRRVDGAALLAFQRSLATLETLWLGFLVRAGGTPAVYGPFFRFLLPSLREYRRGLAETALYSLIEAVSRLVLPLSGKYLLDQVIPSGSTRNLAAFILILLLFYALNPLIDLRRIYIASKVSQRILATLQRQMFTHLERLPHSFYAENQIAELMGRFTDDLQNVSAGVREVTSTGFYWILTAVLTASTMLVLSPVLAAPVLLVIPLSFISTDQLGARWRHLGGSYRRHNLETLVYTQQYVSGHAAVKTFTLEAWTGTAYHRWVERLLQLRLRREMSDALTQTSVSLLLVLGQILVFSLGGYLAIEHDLTTGTLVAFTAFLPGLFAAVEQVIGVMGRVAGAANGALCCMALIDEPLVIADAPGAVALPPLREAIQLEDVSASYGSQRAVLRGLTLTLPAGMHTAIVGPSGSGKSTLINLLMRFWDPETGRVLLDGRDARTVQLATLREQIGLISQDTFVIESTVRENIALGRPDASDAEVEDAARAAGLDELIGSLPARLDTLLGERGVRLTRQQQIRLATARVLLRNPRIVIIDDAITQLDASAERDYLRSLQSLFAGRTVIHITRHLGSAALADRIIVLDQGQVAEEGTHERLVRDGGLYQRLYQEQLRAPGSDEDARVGAAEARLHAVSLFGGIDLPALSRLASKLIRIHRDAGVDIVREGDPGGTMYVIGSGQVEVLLATGAGRLRVAVLNEGDYFGEMALLSGSPRTATVRTIVPTELFVLSRADFLGLVEREPAVRRAVEETMAARRASNAEALPGSPESDGPVHPLAGG